MEELTDGRLLRIIVGEDDTYDGPTPLRGNLVDAAT